MGLIKNLFIIKSIYPYSSLNLLLAIIFFDKLYLFTLYHLKYLYIKKINKFNFHNLMNNNTNFILII